MKKNTLLFFLSLMLSSFNGMTQLQAFTYQKCALSSSGDPNYFNISKSFTGVQLATHDVQISLSMLGCNPYTENSGGIKLVGTSFVEINVPVGHCSYSYAYYTIDKDVFNQAVTAGSGTIQFQFYIRDRCVGGMGCNSYSDPCIEMSVINDYSCVPTTGIDHIISCGPYTWIDGLVYSTNNNTATHVLTNAAGCDSTVTLNLTIGDNTAPIADLSTLSDVTSQCSVTTLTAPTATDNCTGAITGTHDVILPITSQGTTVVTWTFDDGNGNTSSQTQNVIITNGTPPTPDIVNLPDVIAICTVTSLTAPTATDNCSGSIIGTHNVTLPITTQGTTVITWTYVDGYGNSATQFQNIVITDNVAPVPTTAVLSNVIAECSVATLTVPTATDNCVGTINGTHNIILPITSQDTTVVVWTFDDGNGNITTQNQNVIISDITSPVANVTSLPTINAACSVTTLTAPTATDNCTGTIVGTHNATLPITISGVTVVTWTYNDGNGNITTQNQNIVISDVTAPVADVATLSPVITQCSINNLVAPTATDDCAGIVTGVPNVTFPITQQGTFVITWTFNDGNGNTSTQTQNITIDDQTAPVVDNAILSPIVSNCFVTSLTAPTATDNCAGTILGVHDVILPINTVGTTTITWTFDDGNGNVSTQNQQVTVSSTVDNNIVKLDNSTFQAVASGSNVTYQWVDCDDNNSFIVGETNQSFTTTTSGNFACQISNGTCTVLSDCQTSTLGVDQKALTSDLILYPNPTDGNVIISLGKMTKDVKVSVYNTLGKLIETSFYELTDSIIMMIKGQPGMYLITIQAEEKSTTLNVVKN